MPTGHPAYRLAALPGLATALILMVPLVAMQFTDQVVWGPLDFAVMGALLFGTGLMYQLAARQVRNLAYRAAAGIALAAAFLLVWINLAVGIIGDEGNPANLMYLGVLTIGAIGALLARFRPRGLARAMFATALAQALVALIALIFELGALEPPGPLGVLALHGCFVALFAGSALLFRHAARAQGRGAEPSRRQPEI